MISHAKSVARRSVLIDHCDHEIPDLSTEYSNIEKIYTINKETQSEISKLSLVEFKSEADADIVARQAMSRAGVLPVPLKILQYRSMHSRNPAINTLILPEEHVDLSYKCELAKDFDNYDDFLSRNMMSLVTLKLKFITLVNVERVICSGLFEQYELMPFGSSFIDFCSNSGDLDLLMTRKGDHNEYIKSSPIVSSSSSNEKSTQQNEVATNLAHLGKNIYRGKKSISGLREVIRLIDFMLRDFLPLTDSHTVLSIVHAKVPIIKFNTRVTNIDVDLSFNLGLSNEGTDPLATKYSGVIMAHILYSLCRTNNLIAPVIVCIRNYAKLTSITSKGSPVKFTNFQLLSLIIFYLQQFAIIPDIESTKTSNHHEGFRLLFCMDNNSRLEPIVPPFKDLLELNSSAGSQSVIKYSRDELELLIPMVVESFFKYYSQFDFAKCSLDLFESKIGRKYDNSPIYVKNPVDRSANICYNLHTKGLAGFVKQVKTSSSQIKAEKSGQDPVMNILKNLLSSVNRMNIDGKKFMDRQLTTENIVRDVLET